MRTARFKVEAAECRRQAAAFHGRPEGPFLLRVVGMSMSCLPRLLLRPGRHARLETRSWASTQEEAHEHDGAGSNQCRARLQGNCPQGAGHLEETQR
jgi:hypothetical protein